jgi:hypothetical protein
MIVARRGDGGMTEQVKGGRERYMKLHMKLHVVQKKETKKNLTQSRKGKTGQARNFQKGTQTEIFYRS